MARKSSSTTAEAPPKRVRRNEADLIAALEAKIEALKQRAAARQMKQSPSLKATRIAIQAIDKAAAAAEAQGESALRHALADARQPLVEYLAGEGIEVGPTRRPRGRRPKGAGAVDGNGQG
jgi:hypothetical protein